MFFQYRIHGEYFIQNSKMSPLVRRRLKLINTNIKKRRGFKLLNIIVKTLKFILISGAFIQNI